MGRAELQVGKPVQRPFKNQVREKDGGFGRISDAIFEEAVSLYAGNDSRGHRAVLRVHKDKRLQLLRLGPERVELWGRQFLTLYASSNCSATHSQVLDRVFHLLGGEF